MTAWRPGARLPALDGLRGVAILGVMLYHQTLIGQSPAPVDRALALLPLGGWAGVDLFFVLSGFLITGILWDARGAEHAMRDFYARRVLRIFPLYYAVVAFALLVLPNLPHPRAERWGQIAGDELWYWLFLSNFSIAASDAFRHGILDVSWSLAIEEQFYLLWPPLVLWMRRERLMRLCAALVVGALAWRVGALLAGMSPFAVLVLTPGRVDGLAVGAFVALAVRAPGGLERLGRAAPVVVGASLAVLAGIAAHAGGLHALDAGVQSAGFTALASLWGGVLVLALTSARVAAALERPALMTLGRFSFALYLFHLPVRAALHAAIGPYERGLAVLGSFLPAQLVFYAVSTAATLGLAWLSWHLYEKRFLALKRHFGAPPHEEGRSPSPLRSASPREAAVSPSHPAQCPTRS